MPLTHTPIQMRVVPDEDADISYLYQDEFADRLNSYHEGTFSFVGVQAVTQLKIPYGQDFILSELASPGLWGIEDDSDDEYLAEVYAEEKHTLEEMLKEMGATA